MLICIKKNLEEFGMKKNIIFLTHGSKQVGMGHVMRCLSLAKAFQNKNWKVSFYSKFYLGASVIKKQGFPVVMQEQKENTEVVTDFRFGNKAELKEDLEWLMPLLTKDKPTILLVDGYNVSEYFFKKLKQYTECLVYLDDLAAWDYPVDVLLNPNVDAEQKGYTQFKNVGKFLLGSSYCLLRDEFTNVSLRTAKEEVRDILITTGAADPKNITKTLLEWGRKIWINARFHLIIGSAFEKKEEWRKKENERIKIYVSPEKMSEIMLQCDLAISAGGSTLYELAACGVPTIAFVYSENQRGVVETLEKFGYIKNIGWWEELLQKEQDGMDVCVEWISECQDKEKRQKWIQRQQKLFDGKGTRRVEEELEEYLSAR